MSLRIESTLIGFSLVMTSASFAQVESFHDPEPKWSTSLFGEPTKIVAASEGLSFAVCWSAGPGLMVASVHDVSSGALLQNTSLVSVPAVSARDVAWSPTTNRLAVGYLSSEGEVQTRLVNTLTSLPVGAEHVGDRLAFDASGSMLVIGGFDSYIRLVDALSGSLFRAYEFEGELSDVAIDSTGGVVGACSTTGELEVWDMASGQSLFRRTVLGEDGNPVGLTSLSISAGCTYVGAGTTGMAQMDADKGRALVWEISTGDLLYDRQIANGGINKVVWTNSESELLALGLTDTQELIFSAWDIVENRTVVSIPPSGATLLGGVHDFDYDRSSSIWALTTGNGTVEAFGPGLGCISDLNGSGVVDGSDFASMLASWGKLNTTADQNGDGFVNGIDMSYMLTNWGSCSD